MAPTDIAAYVGNARQHQSVHAACGAYLGTYHDIVDASPTWFRLPAVNMPMRGGKYPWRTPLERPRVGVLSTGKAPL